MSGPAPTAIDPNLVDDPAPARTADPNLIADPKAGPATDPNLVSDPGPNVEPNMNHFTQMAKANLSNPEGANGFWAGLHAGFEKSSASLIFRKPTDVPPEHADLFYRIASGAGTAVGDIPAFVIGGIGGIMAGGSAGGAVANVPGALGGATVGGWAGAGALPAIIRKAMMDHYEKGEVTSARDFLGRFGGAVLAGLKGAAVNVATMGVGRAVGPIASGVAGELVGGAAKTGAEVATMTTVAAGVEGRLPEPHEFIDNGFVVGGTHFALGAASSMVGKMRGTYAETGLHPAEQAQMALEDPVLKQKMQSTQDSSVPQEFKDAAPKEEVSENDKAWKAANPEPKDVPAPKSEPHPNFSEDSPVGQVSVPQMEVSKEAATAEPVEPPAPPPEGSLDAAKAWIRSKITSAPDITPEPLTWDKVQQRVLDQTHGLAVLARELKTGEEIPTLQDPYLLGRLTAGVNSMFRAAVEFGPVDPDTKQSLEGVKSYKEIFEPLSTPSLGKRILNAAKGEAPIREIVRPPQNRLNEFQEWMVAKRVVEKAGQGTKAFGEDNRTDLAKQVADAGETEFAPVAKEYATWKNSFIDHATKRGLFSEEQAAKIKDMNKSHISFNRLFEGEEAMGPGGKNLKVNNPVKKMTGSERPVVDPLENDMMNAYKLMQASERNAVINSVAKLADNNPEKAALPESLFQKAAPEFQKIQIKGDEVNKAFEDEGVDPEATGDFWRAKHTMLGENQVQSFVDGKRVVWDTTPAAAEAIKGMQDNSQSQALQNFINGPGRLLRTAQMMYPVFWERHLVRSQENAAALSKLGAEPLMQMHNAIAGMFRNTDDYQQFLASGGGNESWHSIQDYIDKIAGGTLEKKTNFMDAMWNGVKSIPEATILGFHKMEESLHFAKYLAERGKDQSPESIANAAFEARSVNGDIAMRGSSNLVKWYSAATPFWAQHMAGLAETGKAFSKDFGGTFAKMAAIYTLPAIYNWWQNKDDERWHDLPPWQKTMSIPIFTNKWEDAPLGVVAPQKNTAYSRVTPEGKVQINNGSPWKIPMFETGMIFASLPVGILDAMYRTNPEVFKGFGAAMSIEHMSDEDSSQVQTRLASALGTSHGSESLAGFGEGLAHTAMPLDVPAALHPILEHFANKSTLTGNPIIPSSMEGKNNIEPQFKYTDYTSESAKQIGKIIHQIPVVGDTDFAAPMMVENYVRSWTGGPGMLALKLADKAIYALPASARAALDVPEPVVKPDGTWADNPFTLAFAMRNPGMSAVPIRKLFDNYDKYQETKNTVETLKKRGDLDALEKYTADPEVQKNLIPQDSAHKAVMNMSHFLREITMDPNMSAHDKRQLYDWTMVQMVQTAQGMNTAREELRADFDQAGR